MRNPMNSWEKSDSIFTHVRYVYDTGLPETFKLDIPIIGENDLSLMKRLYSAGTEHRKYLRQIFVSMDITAPLYWYKEFDTYKIGITANSTSTMHKITSKEFTMDDFSHEHLTTRSLNAMDDLIDVLNMYRELYINGGRDYWSDRDDEEYAPKDKHIWWQLIQLLPTSYNQTRTITMNYENVFNIIHQRTGHKLDEWNEFVSRLKDLPYIKEIGDIS